MLESEGVPFDGGKASVCSWVALGKPMTIESHDLLIRFIV